MFTVICVLLALAMIGAWSLRPWQWSLVDDPDYRLGLLEAQRQNGWLGGISERVVSAYKYDRAGGQMRPFLWVYSALFYMLTPGVAHLLRLIMFLASIGGVTLAVHSRLAGVLNRRALWLFILWAGCALAAIRGLYDGLSFMSIMELPTVVFVAIAVADRSLSRKVLWLLLASLCKTPVVSGVFALAAVLYFRGRRKLALLTFVMGLVIVLWAREFALGGSYTANYDLTGGHAKATVVGLFRQAAIPSLIIMAGLLWVKPPRSVTSRKVKMWLSRIDVDVFVCAAAGLGYTALLLPWGSSAGYNLAPPAFLLVSSAVLFMARSIQLAAPTSRSLSVVQSPANGFTRILGVVPVGVAVVLGLFVSFIGIQAALKRDATIRAVVSWAASLPEADQVATNGEESAVRYDQLLKIYLGNAASAPNFTYLPAGAALPCSIHWLVVMHDQGPYVGDIKLDRYAALPLGDIYRVRRTATGGGLC